MVVTGIRRHTQAHTRRLQTRDSRESHRQKTNFPIFGVSPPVPPASNSDRAIHVLLLGVVSTVWCVPELQREMPTRASVAARAAVRRGMRVGIRACAGSGRRTPVPDSGAGHHIGSPCTFVVEMHACTHTQTLSCNHVRSGCVRFGKVAPAAGRVQPDAAPAIQTVFPAAGADVLETRQPDRAGRAPDARRIRTRKPFALVRAPPISGLFAAMSAGLSAAISAVMFAGLSAGLSAAVSAVMFVAMSAAMFAGLSAAISETMST